MVLLLSIMPRLFADEVALTITQKLSQTTGEASTTVGDITFNFTGTKTTYQNAYVKMVPESGLTVSTSTGTISKIVLAYADGRKKSETLTITPNLGTWDATSSTWTAADNSSTSSVTLTCSGDGERSVSGVTVTYTPTKALTFSNSQVTGDLTTLGQMVQNPTNASGAVTYTSSNDKLAQIDGNGWIRFVNTGIVTISAKDASGATGSYILAINATDAQATVNGNTLTVTETGKISNKNVVSVPYIRMQIGNANEASLVRAVGNNKYLTITNLDTNGFSHVFVDDNTGLPTMGTYYAFTPTVSGTLTVTGVFDGRGKNGAQLYEGNTSVGSIAFVSNFAEATNNFTLKANTTYYLYVPTVGDNYDFFCLHSFSFASDYYFETKKHIASPSETSFTQTVKDGSSSTYTAKAYGDLQNVSVDSNGKVSWSGNGGAIVVTAKDKTTSNTDDGSSDSYVITVPYATHEWNFKDDKNSYNDMTASTSDWDVTYKVRQYDTNRALTYLNVPVMANGTALDGTNALYFPATAGLLINSDADGMGSNIYEWNNDVNYDGMTLNEKLALDYTQANRVGLLTLYKNSTLTIPNLKKGQYVRIKWCRYAAGKGDHIMAKNATDLNGKDITSTFNIGRTIYDNGYEFFIVEADGDISFTPTDDGWIEIYNITVANEMPATDMILVEKDSKNFASPLTYTNKTTVNYSQVPAALHIVTCMSNGNDGTVKYSAYCKKGNITFTMSEDGKLDVTGGQGILAITQEGINSGYTLDRKITDVTVYEKKKVTKAYPFTWDFANNKTTADAFTGDEWTKNSDGTFTLNAKSWNYFQGNDLQKAENGSDILETQDLGIDVPHDKDNSLTIELGKGLKFGSNDNQVLTIPQVKSGYKAYILASIGNNGSIAKDGITLSGETYKNDNSKTIFVIDGNGSDINLTVKNALIEKIGVTGTFKKFNAYNGKSFATEYRDHNERYDLTEIFTNGKKVEANVIQEVDNNAHLAKTSSISIAPKETGVILTCSATEDVDAIPLFVKDVNSNEDDIKNNMLKGTLTETNQLESNGVNYVFTRVSYNLDKDGNIVDSDNGKQSTLGFYRVANNDDSSLDANKAYLHISVSSPAKFYVIEGLFDDNTTTDITNISNANHFAGEDGVYYTLTGIRLSGRPTHAGIYVLNGKKVIIK